MELRFTWVTRGNVRKMCEKGVRRHLEQGHAESADEASIVVLQSNGGRCPTRKRERRVHFAHKLNASVDVLFGPHIRSVHSHIHLGAVD